MREKVTNIKSWIKRHKYLVVIIAFFVFKMFFDRYSLYDYIGMMRDENRLQNDVEKYKKEIKKASEQLEELNDDSTTIERIARERYLMKKGNEDVYVFEEDYQ